jgi:superfamily II DNA/RNA helicase
VFGLKKLKLGSVRSLIIDEVDNLLQDPFIGEVQMLIDSMPLLNRKKDADAVDGALSSSSGMPKTKPDLREPDSNPNSLLVDYDSSNNKNNMDDDDENELEDDYEQDNEEEEEEEESSGSTIEAAEMVGGNYKKFICLSSATGNSQAVKSFASLRCGENNWSLVAAKTSAQLPSTITHGLVSCARIKSLDILRKILNAQPTVKCALIFVNDPYRVNIIVDKLAENGIIAAPLHGDTSKEDRKEIISRLRDGRLSLAVSTELAARGLDLPELTHVINFELPTDAQHYVHRYYGQLNTIILSFNSNAKNYL